MNNRILMIVILASLLFSTGLVAAQDGSGLIYFSMDGDIWSYNPDRDILTQETTWGYNQAPVMSPDGLRFAYVSLASIAAENASSGEFYSPDLSPTNIWIWDVATHDSYRLVDQPDDLQVIEFGFNNYVSRRSLAWSPDGSKLAWISLNWGAELANASLSIHDFTTNTTTVVNEDMPFPFADAGNVATQPLVWGENGLALLTFGFVDNEPTDLLYIYDNDGNLITDTALNRPNNEFVWDIAWISPHDIALISSNGQSESFSLTSRQTSTIPNNVGMIPTNGAGDFQPYGVQLIDLDGTYRFWWRVVTASGLDFSFETKTNLYALTLDPSGNRAAHIDDALYVWREGIFERVAGTDSLADEYQSVPVWGGTRFTVIGFGGQIDAAACPAAPAPRLVIGGSGFVVPDLGNNALRDAPGLSEDGSNEIGVIPPNGQVTVLAGPECVSGYNWWQVNYDGQIGWTAEGEGNTYWLQPN